MAYKITVHWKPMYEVSPEQAVEFVDWVWKSRHVNCFDPDVVSYPRSTMLWAADSDGPLLYLPIQPVLMLESLAPRPELSPRKEAIALWQLGLMLESISKETGMQETYFLCKDDTVADICKQHGFSEMEGYRILKKKVPTITVEEIKAKENSLQKPLVDVKDTNA